MILLTEKYIKIDEKSFKKNTMFSYFNSLIFGDSGVKETTTFSQKNWRIKQIKGPYGDLIPIQFVETPGIFWFNKHDDDRIFQIGEYVNIIYTVEKLENNLIYIRESDTTRNIYRKFL